MLVAAGLPFVGYLPLLWLNVATFVAPMIVWWLGTRPPPDAHSDDRRFNLVASLKVGWTAVWSEPRLVASVLTMLPLDFAASTATTTLAIFYLRDSFEVPPTTVSICVVVMNIAAFIGSIAVSERARFPVRTTLAVVTVGMMACLFVVAVPNLAVVIAALALFSAFTGAVGVASSMLTVKYVPAEVMGRASGILRFIWGIPAVLAPATVPLVVTWAGVQNTFIVLGLVALSSVLVLWAMWRRWSDAPPAGTVPAVRATVPTTDLET